MHMHKVYTNTKNALRAIPGNDTVISFVMSLVASGCKVIVSKMDKIMSRIMAFSMGNLILGQITAALKPGLAGGRPLIGKGIYLYMKVTYN